MPYKYGNNMTDDVTTNVKMNEEPISTRGDNAEHRYQILLLKFHVS